MLIMYVDDDRAPREAITSMLEALGHTVDTFNDPRAALLHYRRTTIKYDLVVTDYHMPMFTGVALAVELRGLSPEQKIVVITGDPSYVKNTLKGQEENYPVNAVLGKPCGLVDLATVIHSVCHG